MTSPTERGITRMILGIVAGNLALDLVRSRWDVTPKMKAVGEGTDLYVFHPSRGGGEALIRVDKHAVKIEKIRGRPSQRARMGQELMLLFPDGVSGAV